MADPSLGGWAGQWHTEVVELRALLATTMIDAPGLLRAEQYAYTLLENRSKIPAKSTGCCFNRY